MNKPADVPADVIVEAIPISAIALSGTHYQEQRRKHFKPEALLELAASIQQIGVQQPIVVRQIPPANSKQYEIVFGERRMIAADRAGNAHVPCIVRNLSDEDVIVAQLTENKQREDDNPLAEAEGYADLKELKGYDAEKIGELIGKSRSYVFSRLKLRDLCPEAREALDKGEIDYSKALLVARFAPKLQPKALKAISGDWVTHRNAFSQLRYNFTADLSKAPFALDDARTGVQVGPQKFAWGPRAACTECTSNSRNDGELGLDESTHVCTDKPCFELKAQAYWAERKAEAEAAGRTVLSGDEAKAALPPTWQGYNDRFVRLDAECEEAEQLDEAQGNDNEDDAEPAPLPTFRALLADAKLTPVIAQSAEGLVELVPIADAVKALKKKGITIDVPGTSQSSGVGMSEAQRASFAAERARDEERQKVELTFRKRVLAEVHAKWKGPLKRPDLERIAIELHNAYGFQEWDALGELYPDGIDDFQKLKDDELTRYIVLNLIADDTGIHGGKPGKLLEVAQRLKIDTKRIRTGVVRDLRPVSAPAPEEEASADPALAAVPAKAPAKKKATAKKPAAKKPAAKK